MPDLWLDDIQDPAAYPDAAILNDIRALIKADQREGTVLDYKKDISDKDTWPAAAAAFTNSYGGLIIFGVEAKGDQPRHLTGFDPQGIETKTRLGSILLSRVQPRPDFQIRVVTLDTDKTKEVALLRISQGSHPPYVHAKEDERRVYIRVGAQKAEADYLQLSALFEKRKQVESEAEWFLADLTGGASRLNVHDPPESNLISRHWYRFVLAPDDERAARRLTSEVEEQFRQYVERLHPTFRPNSPITRTAGATYLLDRTNFGGEQLFSVTSKGALGFATHACFQSTNRSDTPPSPFFSVERFYRDFINFMSLGALFYDKSRYYGDNLLDVSMQIIDKAQVWQAPILFAPPLETIQVDNFVSQMRVTLHPPVADRWQGYLEAVVNDLARYAGRVLSSLYHGTTKGEVEVAINRLLKR